ncbi:MAG TPA: TonB-dependent receptor [Longimicrobiales bacterium]
MQRFLRTIVLVLAAIALPSAVAAQERGTVTGQVTDQNTGAPIVGAQVAIVGTTHATVTNREGRFLLPAVPTGAQTLQVVYIGYQTATIEIQVTASTVADVALTPDILRLDELVVVGYGTQRRRNISGAISSLDPSAVVEDAPIVSVDNVLQGRVPGVQVTQNSGNPGSAITVRVRGASSISAGNQPLYVIDGVPMTQGNFSMINGAFGGQDIDALADLNPNNIESIEVLKDASAAAIYGSRASNGVVLITTKRGIAAERPRITVSGYYGVQQAWNKIDMADTDLYIDVYNEAYGVPIFGYSDDGVANDFEIEPGMNTDWLDQVFRPAPIRNFAASIAGGSGPVRYFVAGSSLNQDGIVEGFGYERLNGRLNLDYTASDRLTLGTNVALTRGRTRRSASDNTIYGPFANAIASPPWHGIYDEDGNYLSPFYANPVGLAKENFASERSVHILGNMFGTFNLFSNVDLRASVGLDHYNLRSYLYDSPIIGPAVGSGGASTSGDAYVTKLVYEATVNWLQQIGTDHLFSGVVGTSYEDNTRESSSVSGQSFPSSYFRYITSAASITDGDADLAEWSLVSFFSRLSYTYADRYTATFNLRADGSSRFGADNRYGFFPSGSLLWRVSDEPFLRDQDVISDLAFRLSYGRTGNQQGIGNFASRGLYTGGANYEDTPGLAPDQLANPDLKWETTDQFNVGADVAFIENRLGITADYYIKTTKDLLVSRPVPRTTGFSSVTSNVGSMENRGFELGVHAELLRGGPQDFNWAMDLNLSRNVNEVTELYNDQPFVTGFVSRVEEGKPLGFFWGYKTDGIFRSQEEVDNHAFQDDETAPGDVRFVDVNGDGVIDDADRTLIGTPWPDFVGGLTNTLSYRGIDLSVFLQFSSGNEIYNGTRIYTDAYGASPGDNVSARAADRWSPDNPDGTEPRATADDPNNNARDSDRFIEDGSYLRVKNAVLGYTFPASIAQRLGMRNLRVYLQAQNLLTFTDYSGFDPEVNYAGEADVTRGTDFYTLPQPRTITFGFNVGF